MERQEPGPGHVAEFNGARCGKDPNIPIGVALSAFGDTPSNGIRRNLATSIEGRERNKRCHRENPGNILVTASYIVKKILRPRAFRRAKNRLHSNLSAGYNPRNKSGVCVYCMQSVEVLDNL